MKQLFCLLLIILPLNCVIAQKQEIELSQEPNQITIDLKTKNAVITFYRDWVVLLFEIQKEQPSWFAEQKEKDQKAILSAIEHFKQLPAAGTLSSKDRRAIERLLKNQVGALALTKSWGAVYRIKDNTQQSVILFETVPGEKNIVTYSFYFKNSDELFFSCTALPLSSSNETPHTGVTFLELDETNDDPGVKVEDEIAIAQDDPMETEVNYDEIFVVVEQPPEYPLGYTKLSEFIKKNLQYPQKAKQAGTEGTVFVQFIILQDGTLNDVQAIRGIGNGCDEEAIRLVKSMPNWNPGKQNGKPVKVRFVLPVIFKLD